MKIKNQPQSYNKSSTTPSFEGNCRTVRDALGKMKYRNNTAFFRPDLNFNRLVSLLTERYQGADRVHIYNYACSEGAEPFSLAMLLIQKLGAERARKFLPIIASDIDEKILENPKAGVVKLSPGDLFLIKRALGKDYSRFIEHDGKFKYDDQLRNILCDGQVTPLLRDSVVFQQANILDDVGRIERDNSVVMCRNFWPYLPKQERHNLAEGLSQQLGDSSMCVIGAYDRHWAWMKRLFGQHGMTRVSGNPLFYEKAAQSQENTPSPNLWQRLRKKT